MRGNRNTSSGFFGLIAAFCLLVFAGPGLATGPDVIYSDCTGITNWGVIGGIRGYSLGSHTCNIGDENLDWGGFTPLLAMNAYRLHEGRLMQIGMSWVKNGTTAGAGSGCGLPCNGQGGGVLGAGCLDVYSSGFNGGQSILGPRSDVNAFTGDYPGPSGGSGNAIYKRLQVAESDLMQAEALYFVEGVYVAWDDAEAGNALNNASYKRVTVGASFNLTVAGSMFQTIPAIYAWRDHGLGVGIPDNSVEIVAVDVPNEGRFFLGSKVTPLGTGQFRYDYVLYNLNSYRSGGSLSVPIPIGANVSGVGFHDVPYHSGEPYDNADWPVEVGPSSVTWHSPQTASENPNSNALRFATMYNYWFESDRAPAAGTVTIGLFRPTAVNEIAAASQVPGGCSGDCLADVTLNGLDISPFVSCILGVPGDCACADMDGNQALDEADIELFVENLVAGGGCQQ